MNDKSFVSMEMVQCPACDKLSRSGNLLMDKRVRPSLERETLTGFGLCAEHWRDGFITLIGCDPEQSGVGPTETTITPRQAYRTGEVVYLRREAWDRLFDVPFPANCPWVYVEDRVIQELKAFIAKHSNEGGESCPA